MRKVSLLAIVTVVLAASVIVAWYWASPYFAVAGLRNAAIRGDAAELGQRIDFPRLREDMKTQISAFVMAGMGERLRDNPFAALGMALAAKLTEAMVDAMVTPAGMLALMELKRDGGSEVSGFSLMFSSELAIHRDGLGSFDLYAAKDKEKVPAFRFARSGIGWKLVGIEMPKEFLAARSGGIAQDKPTAAAPSPKWQLSDRKDPMDDAVSTYLHRDADEEVSVRYSKVRPTVVFRCQKKKLEAYINLRSRVDYDYQTHRSAVRLRFDDGEAKRESWIASDDREALFAPNPTLFLGTLRKSSALLFEWRQSGDSVFVAKFTSDDLEAHVGRLAGSCGTAF